VLGFRPPWLEARLLSRYLCRVCGPCGFIDAGPNRIGPSKPTGTVWQWLGQQSRNPGIFPLGGLNEPRTSFPFAPPDAFLEGRLARVFGRKQRPIGTFLVNWYWPDGQLCVGIGRRFLVRSRLPTHYFCASGPAPWPQRCMNQVHGTDVRSGG